MPNFESCAEKGCDGNTGMMLTPDGCPVTLRAVPKSHRYGTAVSFPRPRLVTVSQVADILPASRLSTVWDIKKMGSAQEFDRAPISCGFLKGYEFYLGGGQALSLQQQIA